MRDFVVLDFETANHNRSSVCAVGLVQVLAGEVADSRSWLVRPQPAYFARRNTEIHGIDETSVRDAAEFPAVWEQARPLIGENTLAAYNAPFDMSALLAALEAHQLPPSETKWSCVLRLARQTWPDLERYTLPIVAQYLGIELQHHDPLSDAQACAKIALKALDYLDLQELPILQSQPARTPRHPDEVLNGFCDLVRAITQDGVITMAEFNSLHDWLCSHLPVLGRWPYSEVAKRVDEITTENCLTEERHSQLLAFLQTFLQTGTRFDPVAPGIFTCGENAVAFLNKYFVLTGMLASMERPQAEDLIRSLGGRLSDTVSQKTDFLVVGSKGNRAWKNGSRGVKIDNAETLHRNGGKVQIVSEETFLRATAISRVS
jgi:DNA polymerase-3 subunit epsilon